MKKIGFIMVGIVLLGLFLDGLTLGEGIYVGDMLGAILYIVFLLIGLVLIFIDNEDENFLKKTGFIMVGLFLLLLLLTGFNFEDVFDVIFRIGLLLIGLALIFIDSWLSSVNSTARTTRRSVNTGTGSEKPSAPPPQPQMVCPECGKKYPLDQIYCEECGSLLKKS